VAAAAPESVLDRLPGGIARAPLSAGLWRHDPRLLMHLARLLRSHRPDVVVHARANKAA